MRANFVLDYDVLTVEQPQKLYLLARLESGPAAADSQRRPLNLSLVIDRSGSMKDDKIDFTRQAAQFLVQHLSLRDILSIVLYNDRVETLLEPVPITNKDLIVQRIATIKVGGTTNLSAGWLEGCRWVAQNLDTDHLNRVILISDGLANRGIIDEDKLVAIGQQKRGERITTTTMGLGNDFNEDLLMAIASAGGGAFHFIDSPEVTPLIFKEELEGLLNVVGQNLTVTVQPTAHVSGVKQLNAYPSDKKDQRVIFRLGDVFADEIKTLMLEFSIPALKDIGQQQIATLRFEYDELVEEGVQHHDWEMPVIVNVTPSTEHPPLPNTEVQQNVLLLKAAQARREAVTAADKGDFATASQILRDVASAISISALEDDQLEEERQALENQAERMEQGQATYNDYSRKSMSTQAIYSMTNRHDDTVMLRFREQERQEAKPTKPHARARSGITPTHLTWDEKTYPLDHDLIRIGRAPQNEIVVDVVGISRFHCQIKRLGGKLLLEDLGSTNGTHLNDDPIDAPCELSVGDKVTLCDVTLIFHNNDDIS